VARYKPAHRAARPGRPEAFGTGPEAGSPSPSSEPDATRIAGTAASSGGGGGAATLLLDPEPAVATAPVPPVEVDVARSGRARRDSRRTPVVAVVAGVVVVALIGTSVAVAAALRGHRAAHAKAAASSAQAAQGAQEEETAATAPAQLSVGLGPAGPTAAWVKAENAKPGSAGWRLTDIARDNEIEGYADRVSINMGERVSLYISTTTDSYHVEVYRMGYYQGLGARLVWTSPTEAGVRQARPTVASGTNMVEARWDPSITVQTTEAAWPEGDYLFKLVASTGKQSYIALTIRNDQSKASFEVMNAVTTWQAYNLWGGYDLYEGSDGRASDGNHRATVVSFDRPYKIGDGSGDFLGNEYPLVSLLESQGSDITYVTNVDVDEHPERLSQHKALISLGHDEYYSLAMRNGLESARDSGVNLMFLGANAIYRHIRFASSPLGPDRHEINYRSASADPLTGKDDADVTVSWREPPTNDPESKLIGDYYQCNPVQADMVVSDASDWIFAGTGVKNGQKLAGVVGSEYDRYTPRSAPTPPNVQVLTHSPLVCRGKSDYSDSTYYTASSGAGVFASGTIAWIAHLDQNCAGVNCAGPTLIKMTQNLLATFGAGPAGSSHPSLVNGPAIDEGEKGTTTTSSSSTLFESPGGSSASSTTSSAPSFTNPPSYPYTPPGYRPPVTHAPSTTIPTSTTKPTGTTAPGSIPTVTTGTPTSATTPTTHTLHT